MVLRSTQFDDVYFSVDDGVAETHHVFLEGNDCPNAWAGCDRFTIAETGFGTGLNFLCAWKVFEKTASADQRLHFISVEKYPLSQEEVKNALSPWCTYFGDKLDRYLSLYPIRVPGPHHIHVTNRVTLTVWFGDIADVMPQWNGAVDAWFLDGFTPAKNPDMWRETVFENMARLSHDKTTFATFTAAGFVKRGLEEAGFSVEKTKGFGRKRDMMRGTFQTGQSLASHKSKRSIAIVGGGLAGCAMAFMANRSGFEVTLYEAGEMVASGASGGQMGMINPKLSALPTAQSDYHTAAYASVLRLLKDIPDIDFQICGSLYICFNDDKDRRFTGYIDNLGWHKDHMRREGKDICYPDGACVSPYKLCHALIKDIDIRLNAKIKSLDEVSANCDCVVIANGYTANDLLDDGGQLPIHPVRGQVSWIKRQEGMNYNTVSGAYMTPQTPEGFHIIGATIDPNDLDVTVREESHVDNMTRWNEFADECISEDDIVGGWAAIRTSSKDRFPVVGKIEGEGEREIYISTSHGSHGIISSLYAADIILSMIEEGHCPAHRHVLKALSPKRFRKR